MLQTSSLGLLLSSLCAIGTTAFSPLATAADTNAAIRRGDWVQGEFDAGHTVHNTSERTINPSNVGSLQLAWSASLVGTIYATPIVAGGRVYIGGGDGRMHAFDALTGAEVWTSKKRGIFYVDSATYADGLVFASAIYAPLTAFNARTGKVVWTSSARHRSPGAGHGRRAHPLRGRLRRHALCPRYANRRRPLVDRGRLLRLRSIPRRKQRTRLSAPHR